jgi:hypothetical protein
MLYGTKQNDGSTPYYLPRIVLYTYEWTTENGTKRAQRQKVNAIVTVFLIPINVK